MGVRQSAKHAFDRVLSDLFPKDRSWTPAETSLAKDIHSLIAKDHLDASELLILQKIVRGIKAVINERQNSD